MSDTAVFRKNEGLVRISGFMSIDFTDTRIRGMGVAAITAGNNYGTAKSSNGLVIENTHTMSAVGTKRTR